MNALLESLHENFLEVNSSEIAVLYKATNENYKKSYDLVKSSFKKIDFIEEEDFWSDLNSILSLTKPTDNLTMFLVDDIIFKNKFSLKEKQFDAIQKYNETVSLSLRLDKNIETCYATGKTSFCPKFTKGMFWNWRQRIYRDTDWGYPMSLDGNVFRNDSICSFLQALKYKNPNTLEAAMATAAENNFAIPTITLCFPEGSKLFNVPVNRVQNEYKNKFEESPDMSEESLNDIFLKGFKINWKLFQGIKNNTVHYPVKFEFITREENKC